MLPEFDYGEIPRALQRLLDPMCREGGDRLMGRISVSVDLLTGERHAYTWNGLGQRDGRAGCIA